MQLRCQPRRDAPLPAVGGRTGRSLVRSPGSASHRRRPGRLGPGKSACRIDSACHGAVFDSPAREPRRGRRSRAASGARRRRSASRSRRCRRRCRSRSARSACRCSSATGARVLITPAGEEVVARARAALAAIDEVRDAARRRARPLVGPLRLGAIPTVAPYWLPARAARGAREVRPARADPARGADRAPARSLTAGQLDVALLALPVPGDFTVAPIARERFVLAAPRGASIVARVPVPQARAARRDGAAARGRSLPARSGARGVRAARRGRVDRGAGDEPADARPDGRRRLGVTLLPETAARALVPARGAVGSPIRRAAARAHHRPRVANVERAAARVPAARGGHARRGRALPREATGGVACRASTCPSRCTCPRGRP